MNIVYRLCTVPALAMALSACASSPEDIKAASVDPVQYSYMTCAQLADYGTQLNATFKIAADQEASARREDVVGYVLLQSPLGSQAHAAIPAEIADLKGRLAAVQQLETSKNCGAPATVASN
jgi:starvation-inducible outer membrane lipoprotein